MVGAMTSAEQKERASGLVRVVAQRLARAAEEAKTRGGMRTGMPKAWVDAGDLSILASWALSPEDGRPTYTELVEALRRLAAPHGFGCCSPDDSPACGLCAGCTANALLARIPREEP